MGRKRNYKTVSIRKELFVRAKRIYAVLGYSGMSAYTHDALRQKLNMDEMRYEQELERILKDEQRRVDLSNAPIRTEQDS